MNVNVDTSSLGAGIGSLTSIVGARQQRVSKIALAIATDANGPAGINPAALAALNQEASIMESLNSQAKALQDKLERCVQAWVR